MKPDELKTCPYCEGEGCTACDLTGYVEMTEQDLIERKAIQAEALSDEWRGH
jgi:hypothetical protein